MDNRVASLIASPAATVGDTTLGLMVHSLSDPIGYHLL